MRASGYKRVANDYYVEPRWRVDALLDVEPLHGTCWDPACGSGTIPLALRARGLACWGSDIVDRGFGITGLDFFVCPDTANNIISNPPFDRVEAFVRRALEKATSKVVILARLAFLESAARQPLFQQTPLARIWVSSRRISMPPGGTDIEAKGRSVAFAWFVWDHRHVGPATIGWI